MRKLVLLVIFLSCATMIFAHPPARIDISINEAVVGVVVTHPVLNPANHYIKRIVIFLNKKRIIDKDFFIQDANAQRAVFNIPDLKRGDTLEVIAYCNQFGDLKETIKLK
jgi:desulfoferrodoxin (superoxide reductase-like protein)